MNRRQRRRLLRRIRADRDLRLNAFGVLVAAACFVIVLGTVVTVVVLSRSPLVLAASVLAQAGASASLVWAWRQFAAELIIARRGWTHPGALAEDITDAMDLDENVLGMTGTTAIEVDAAIADHLVTPFQRHIVATMDAAGVTDLDGTRVTAQFAPVPEPAHRRTDPAGS